MRIYAQGVLKLMEFLFLIQWINCARFYWPNEQSERAYYTNVTLHMKVWSFILNGNN